MCFGSLSLKPLSHKPRSIWYRVMLQYAVIAGLIQFALHLAQIRDFATGKSSHTIAESLQSFTVDVILGLQLFYEHFTSYRAFSLIERFRIFICQSKGLYSFVSPKDFIPFLSLCALSHCSLSRLFCFCNSCFLAAVLPYRPASQSVIFTVDVDTFFHHIDSVVQNCLVQSAFCNASW